MWCFGGGGHGVVVGSERELPESELGGGCFVWVEEVGVSRERERDPGSREREGSEI